VLAIYVVVSGSISPLSSQSIMRPIATGPDGRVRDRQAPRLAQTQPLPAEPVLIFPERTADAVPRLRPAPAIRPAAPADQIAAPASDATAPVVTPPVPAPDAAFSVASRPPPI
jgi:hypothetical protein